MSETTESTQIHPIDDLAHRFWEGFLEREPMMGTFIGDERYDDRLADPGEAGRSAEEAACRATLTELDAIDEDLDDDRTILADLLRAICDRSLARLEHRLDLLDVANHMNGAVALLGQVASVQRTDTPERLDRFEARLHAFPAFLEASTDLLREAVAKGTTAPRVVAERSVAQLERLVTMAPEDSPAAAELEDEAKTRIAAVVDEVVNPALRSFGEVLTGTYLPASTETIGISALPGGDGMYAAEVLGWTSLALDPNEVHAIGVDRVAAIMEERRAVAASLGYGSPEEAIAARTAAGENTAKTPEELVALAEDQVRRSWEAAPAYFGRLPSDNCEVRRVEEFREADEPMAFYYPPTEDGSRPGIYYINAYDLHDRALHHVASVTFHEANPGHHFQIALQQEAPEQPPIRRFGGVLASASFVEGWGLYAERLADEMGLYLNEWERLGMLDNQAFRAARLVTDTGIHAMDWSREQAIAKLEEVGQTHTDSVIEVDRYIGMPGQALCYMIGMIEIQKAREATAAREGSAFDLRSFHDRVLGLGEMPLPSFRRLFGTA